MTHSGINSAHTSCQVSQFQNLWTRLVCQRPAHSSLSRSGSLWSSVARFSQICPVDIAQLQRDSFFLALTYKYSQSFFAFSHANISRYNAVECVFFSARHTSLNFQRSLPTSIWAQSQCCLFQSESQMPSTDVSTGEKKKGDKEGFAGETRTQPRFHESSRGIWTFV